MCSKQPLLLIDWVTTACEATLTLAGTGLQGRLIVQVYAGHAYVS
jgi:hypothetical protein